MNNNRKFLTATRRNYLVKTADEAKDIVRQYLAKNTKENIEFGLPEINDRYHCWKVPLMYSENNVGDIIVNAYSSDIEKNTSSELSIIQDRICKIKSSNIFGKKHKKIKPSNFKISNLHNLVIKGYSEIALKTLPEQSVDLVFTSPPYYNARKQYSEYESYDDYLLTMRKVIRECHRVLINGKFFVINTSHILIPRTKRSESSKRIAVPFDLHQIFIEEGFEFIDDIIWQKPEGAGWASGRGRRFYADRNPMQYKAVPVTEYVMVYRKKPCILIDYFIRNNPNKDIITKSKIPDGYEKTNVWYISPARDKRHPAIFPPELAEKIIQYYSFFNDVVLDPFGGIGTTAKAAIKLKRRFCSIETSDEYIKTTLSDLNKICNNLINPYTFEYKDLIDLVDTSNLVSFDHLVHKLIHEGYTKDELYNILKKGIEKNDK